MTEATRKTIGQRIQEARRKVEYIRRDKQVGGEGGGYKAVTHDWVTAHCRPALLDAGVLVFPAHVTLLQCDSVTYGKKKNVAFMTQALFTIRFASIDGEDYHDVIVPSQAIDTADKGAGKVTSYAQKYAILKMLMLETGDDEESRLPPAERTIDEEQQTLVLEMLDARGSRLDQLGAWWEKYNSGQTWEGVHQLSVVEFNMLMSKWEKDSDGKEEQKEASSAETP